MTRTFSCSNTAVFVVLVADRNVTALPKSSSTISLRKVFATSYHVFAHAEPQNTPLPYLYTCSQWHLFLGIEDSLSRALRLQVYCHTMVETADVLSRVSYHPAI